MSIISSKTSNTSHYLGIDFGKAKIGLAVADSETKIAFSYGVFKNDKKIFDKIKEIVEKEGIGKIIIGSNELCRGLTSTAVEERPRMDFAKKIESKIKIPIEFQSEMFSTREAERNLKEKGARKIKRFDDQEAARIILQSWLDKKG